MTNPQPTLTPLSDTENAWSDEEDYTPMSPYSVVGWACLIAAPVVIFAWLKGWF